MSESRLMELEIKVAYQEDLVQELNKIVTGQQQQIESLKAVCKLLNDKIKSISVEGESSSVMDEVPPHY